MRVFVFYQFFSTVKSFRKKGRRLLFLKCQFSILSTYFIEKSFKYFLFSQIPLPKFTSPICSMCPVLPAALSCDVEHRGSNQVNSINSNCAQREINLINELRIEIFHTKTLIPFMFCSFYLKQHEFLYETSNMNRTVSNLVCFTDNRYTGKLLCQLHSP